MIEGEVDWMGREGNDISIVVNDVDRGNEKLELNRFHCCYHWCSFVNHSLTHLLRLNSSSCEIPDQIH